MQALILAAGVGNRLADAAAGKPKSYLPLAGETLLTRNLRLLRSVGVTRVLVFRKVKWSTMWSVV